MKSQEQRIKDAAAVLRDQINPCNHEMLARRVLEAADREQQWPTDESMRIAWGEDASLDDEWRTYLRAAFLADPIIKAAVRQAAAIRARNPVLDGPVPMWAVPLFEAVNEAGL